MNFDKFFKLISYSVVLCGLFALLASGSIGVLVVTLFLTVTIAAWFLENSRWQISERLGVILIFLVIPLFYLDWKYQIIGFSNKGATATGNLAHLILVLAAIKLLQKKSDRDWVFLYLISFFEVLLAAGSNINPMFLAALALYLLCAICSIIAFEIRRTSRKVLKKNKKGYLIKVKNRSRVSKTPVYRLPLTAISLLLLIIFFSIPLFFILPRVGSANFGKNLDGLSGFTGFSDSVRLGEIGKIQRSDEVVMRVHLQGGDRNKIKNFRWRGVGLDSFDNHGWRKSKSQYSEPFLKKGKGFFQLDTATDASQIVTQTIYLEPIDTPILFALSHPVVIEGNFPLLTKDSEDAIAYPHFGMERLSYKVFSDTALPSIERLRNDNAQYSNQSQRYLKLPDKYDERISNLTQEVIQKSGVRNRYDQAKAIEKYLQNNFGYTLELKAGGDEPLADFLFNIREGHCEYFATAMAVMLRTQGIATRVVNGFQQGEYNETADAYIVKQSDAHSWVEVYFPKENAWIPFDPTPQAGQFPEETGATVAGQFNKFVEAAKTFWVQYVVSYDNQGQRTLFRSVKNNFSEYQAKTSGWLKETQSRLSEWWKEARGDKGFEQSAKAIGFGIGYILAGILGIVFVVWLCRKISRLKLWERFLVWLKTKNQTSIVEFYERMQKVLARRGFRRELHQTPLEFAYALSMPEAVKITEKYNNVRFGEKNLNQEEAREIEDWLECLERRES